MTLNELRKKYLEFFEQNGHTIVPSSSLVPENDPSTLFTSSGMQPMVPFLLGEKHPKGSRLTDSQKSFRSQDIEEVGDSRHTTFFEMLGNWSFGDYFKKEQLTWIYEFLTKELGIPAERLYVTCFEGNDKFGIPKDTESYEVWKSLDMPEDHISFYGDDKNWWNRGKTGLATTPVGDPCGPDSEIFYEFEDISHDTAFGEKCHVNCDCGRFVEIANSVFMEYLKEDESTFTPLTQKNVDFGGGLERILMAVEKSSDVFRTGVFSSIIASIEKLTGQSYDGEYQRNFRIIADHIKASVMLLSDGVRPSNKLQGYVLRRLIRRALRYMRQMAPDVTSVESVAQAVIEMYGQEYTNVKEQAETIIAELNKEWERFDKTLQKGLKEIEKIPELDGQIAFRLYETHGFPFELTEEIARERGQNVPYGEFRNAFEAHQAKSREHSQRKFGGHGLLLDNGEIRAADEEELKKATRLHTATHLLQASLRKVLGESVHQDGSDITAERLRFDFTFDRKLTDEEKAKIEEVVNQAVSDDYDVWFEEMSYEEAMKIGALAFHKNKYPERVKVYFMGRKDGDKTKAFSIELCGGPHVEHTNQVGEFNITKEESISAGTRRIKATAKGRD